MMLLYFTLLMRILTEGSWLREHLQDAAVVDVRPREEYDKGHIPGAILFDIWEYHWFDTTQAGMKKFNEWMAAGLREAGLHPDRTTVVYEGYSGMLAARMIWVLHYFSFKEPLMLDGGLREWLRCGHDLSTDPAALPGIEGFQYTPRAELLATVDSTHSNLSGMGARIIDCRTPDEFSGQHVRADRGGHIPGAVNVEWKRNLTSDGYFLPPSELESVYRGVGIDPKKEFITYCHGGYRSAHTFLALWLIGADRVRNYIGSWGEWGNRKDLPLEE
ncbi:MAG: sulfurtransferase [Nitrospirae bacterium]|nr:sulfurtransferase [Nitrospirota bacterium]